MRFTTFYLLDYGGRFLVVLWFISQNGVGMQKSKEREKKGREGKGRGKGYEFILASAEELGQDCQAQLWMICLGFEVKKNIVYNLFH